MCTPKVKKSVISWRPYLSCDRSFHTLYKNGHFFTSYTVRKFQSVYFPDVRRQCIVTTPYQKRVEKGFSKNGALKTEKNTNSWGKSTIQSHPQNIQSAMPFYLVVRIGSPHPPWVCFPPFGSKGGRHACGGRGGQFRRWARHSGTPGIL